MSDRRSGGGRGGMVREVRRDDRRDDRHGGGGDRRPDDRNRQNTVRKPEPPRDMKRPSNGHTAPRADGGRGGDRGGPPGSRTIHLTGQPLSESDLMSELPKKKFTGRCRLFVGNLSHDLKEDELKELFKTHGEVAECYLSGKGFAFVNMDTRAHAESAKEALDGTQHRGRTLRVRFAMHGAAVRVKELSHTVSNEMLYNVFSNFGEVERAIHVVDEKGRPTGEGIIEFERKPAANEAIAQIRDKVFLITACPKPLVAEPVEAKDEDDGLFERNVPRTPQLQKEREVGPRFPPQNTFEFAYGQKWKELYEVEKQRRALLEDELREGRKRLEADMEIAYQDYQAQMLREDLQRRQQELERLEAARRERMSNMGPPSINMGRGGPPPHMVAPPFQSQQQPNPFSGGPPGPFGVPSLAVPPPTHHHQQQHPQHQQQQFAPPPQQGNPSGPRPNVIEGVQRLLQLFKNDDGRGAGPGNQQNMQQNHPGGAFNNYQPRYGASGDHYGGGSDAFGNQPPMKRERR